LSNDDKLAKKAFHLSTTAKVPHPYEFVHDEVGYNYRLPNLNATLGCAQMEHLNAMLEIKAVIAANYRTFCSEHDLQIVDGIEGTKPNYWLNAIILKSSKERDDFLNYMNEKKIMSRPIWRLMNRLEMFKSCQTDDLKNSRWLEDRVVNIPSSVPENSLQTK
jgi:perosamine synthetase